MLTKKKTIDKSVNDAAIGDEFVKKLSQEEEQEMTDEMDDMIKEMKENDK